MARLGPFELILKLGSGATAEVFCAAGPNARDEALVALNAVTSDDIHRLAAELFHDDRLRLAVVAPARHLRGLKPRLRLPG